MTSLQKRLAGKILKVGESRVWLDPNKIKDIEKAITKWDIRKLVKQGAIKALPEKLHRVKERKKKKYTTGRRKGAKYALLPGKRRWISTVRPLRKMLLELKNTGQIDLQTYKKIRLPVKGGMFRSRSHLKTYLEQHDLLKKK